MANLLYNDRFIFAKQKKDNYTQVTNHTLFQISNVIYTVIRKG